MKKRILILSSDSDIGRALVETLALCPGFTLLLNSQSPSTIESMMREIESKELVADWQVCQLNVSSQNLVYDIEGLAPDVIVDASRFLSNYNIPQICLDLKIHYLDLADSRDHVNQIIELDEAAKENEIVIITGAGLMPGLSSAVIDKYANRFGILREIDLGITASDLLQQGEGRIYSALQVAGKPFQRLERGEWRQVYGWQNLHQHYYGDNLGLRWHGNADIPDLDLLPKRYPMLKTVVFHKGFELPFLHFFIWHWSWLSRVYFFKNCAPLAKMMSKLVRWLKPECARKGGMYVHMYGSDLAFQPYDINWLLVTENQAERYLPSLGVIILIKKLFEQKLEVGARPCLAEFTLDEFEAVASSQPWQIYSTCEEKQF